LFFVEPFGVLVLVLCFVQRGGTTAAAADSRAESHYSRAPLTYDVPEKKDKPVLLTTV
jgi:hypothetical protein